MTEPSATENSPNAHEVLVRVAHLQKYFPVKAGFFKRSTHFVRAVDDVSFSIARGETLGLVGESGCGKSTVGQSMLRLVEPTGGEVMFDSKNLLQLDAAQLRNIRKEIAMIFQDPYSSLNPRQQVLDIVAEPLRTHAALNGAQTRERVLELLQHVGLGSEHLHRYPHQFSGGQRQRISVARALALNPSFLILDEPTSALDVSVQAQVLNLLSDLQHKFNLTYLFISHNLAVVEHISHRVVIMYLGKIVEVGPTRKLFENPLHPYSRALLAAVPNPDPDHQAEAFILMGDVPSAVDIPSGCRFRTRCPLAENICSQETPELVEIDPQHRVACHLLIK